MFCQHYWVTFQASEFAKAKRNGHIRSAFKPTETFVPMLNRFAPITTLAFTLFLTACAGHMPQSQAPVAPAPQPVALADEPSHEDLAALIDEKPYELPALADAVLERGFELVGTPYRYGGQSAKSGFDCSGFIGYVFREELGLKLPRSTRDMIGIDAPRVARTDLEPGDLIFFNNRGRGRVSHAGIYIGDGQFIHSSSSRSGGVRVDSLEDSYWNASYLQAKRVLTLAGNAASH